MRVFVAGGTGFIGGHLVKKLKDDGHDVRMLVRKGSVHRIPREVRDHVERVEGDAFDVGELLQGVAGCDAVINLIGIIRDFPSRGVTFEKLHFNATKNIADAAREKGVSRFVQMSALGADWDEKTEYFRTKWKADQYLIDRDFHYTIFRPSVVFGDGDGFVSTLVSLIKQSPFAVIPGDGTYPLQPVFVGDVVTAFSRALVTEEAVNRVYTVTGPEVFTYREILAEILRAMGKRRRSINLPLPLINPFVILLERFSFFPLTYDQLYMLTRGSVGDNRAFVEDFGISLRTFYEYLFERFDRRGVAVKIE
ncbi:MAG: NAD(P)H-binding protein [Deltaproteobacteria bacterium]|nr:NAD(P)H-binding protein [Deltaproteobacteria bacterium]NIS76850.1 NAD(P)H-binding protein [Deltaproteobacteria bacterium]